MRVHCLDAGALVGTLEWNGVAYIASDGVMVHVDEGTKFNSPKCDSVFVVEHTISNDQAFEVRLLQGVAPSENFPTLIA